MNRTRYNRHRINKKGPFYLIEMAGIVGVLVFCIFWGNWKERFEEEKQKEHYVAIKEALLELQFFVYSNEEWEQFFLAYEEEYLTNEMVAQMLQKLGVAEVIPFEETGRKEALARSEWNAIYEQILDYLDIENRVEVRELLILGKEQQEEHCFLYTNQGIFLTALPEDFFGEWEHYEFFTMEDTCVGVRQKLETEAVLSNSYICSGAENQLTFLYQGNTYQKKVKLGGQEIVSGVADLIVKNGEIVTIRQKQDYIEGNLLSYDEEIIEVEGYGRIAHNGYVPVYQVYEEAVERKLSDIVIGNMDVKFIIGVNEVCAILILAPAELNDVRVLLLAENGSNFRETVHLTSDCGFEVSYMEKKWVQAAGTAVKADAYIEEEGETVIITPETENGLLYFCDASGNPLSNGYSGHMEVRKYADGYCVVNEVPFETYLYSVVPSEMPSSYCPEALKAQAICARSYAYIQMMRADLAAYGAHINDSTSYQVYNHAAKTEASIRAVDETAGKMMLYKGEVVEAYYFSTSMGYTDTICVWNVPEEEPYGYLKQVCLNLDGFDGDLSQEADFKAYLQMDRSGYDSDIKYYRWMVTADYSNLTETIKSVLKSRRSAAEQNITYYRAEDGSETEQMSGFGKWTSMQVTERSKSGSILQLKVNFEHGYAIVENEYNIRKVLGCGALQITFQNGSTAECSALLPSAFCTVEPQADGTYLLHGGGYGHGLGMSQNGANGLAESGYTCEEILKFFYQEIEVMDIRL